MQHNHGKSEDFSNFGNRICPERQSVFGTTLILKASILQDVGVCATDPWVVGHRQSAVKTNYHLLSDIATHFGFAEQMIQMFCQVVNVKNTI